MCSVNFVGSPLLLCTVITVWTTLAHHCSLFPPDPYLPCLAPASFRVQETASFMAFLSWGCGTSPESNRAGTALRLPLPPSTLLRFSPLCSSLWSSALRAEDATVIQLGPSYSAYTIECSCMAWCPQPKCHPAAPQAGSGQRASQPLRPAGK